MKARIVNNKLEYASLEMYIEGIGIVNNPTPKMLADAGYKDVIYVEVDSLEKEFEETEDNIIVYRQKFIPITLSVYEKFNPTSAKNRLFVLYKDDIIKFNMFSAAIIEFINNHTYAAFYRLRIYINNALTQNLITAEDMLNLKQVLQAQDVDLDSL